MGEKQIRIIEVKAGFLFKAEEELTKLLNEGWVIVTTCGGNTNFGFLVLQKNS